MILFFDTETTGLPKNWKAPVSDLNNWPRLVQLAYIFQDYSGNIISKGDFIIKPEGYTISLESTTIHGISTEKALREGKRLRLVLDEFNTLVDKAEYIVSHNLSFDLNILGAEFLRSNLHSSISSKVQICTMECSTNFCAIVGPFGYKWPKLSDLHYKLFHYHFEEAHNAAIDIAATAKCFWELVKTGIIKISLSPKSNIRFSEVDFKMYEEHNRKNEDDYLLAIFEDYAGFGYDYHYLWRDINLGEEYFITPHASSSYFLNNFPKWHFRNETYKLLLEEYLRASVKIEEELEEFHKIKNIIEKLEEMEKEERNDYLRRNPKHKTYWDNYDM